MSNNQTTIADFFDDPADALADAKIQASTDWELDFVEDLWVAYDRWHADMFMTADQAEKLKQIINR